MSHITPSPIEGGGQEHQAIGISDIITIIRTGKTSGHGHHYPIQQRYDGDLDEGYAQDRARPSIEMSA